MNQSCVEVITEESAAERIVADPRPVMIVDTCNFGNLVGLAYSGKSKMIHDTLRCLQDGIATKMFYLVAPEQVYDEFMRPGQFIDSAIREMDVPIRHWNAAVQVYNNIFLTQDLYAPHKRYREFDIEEARHLYEDLVEIGRRYLYQAIIVKASERAQKWAYLRGKDRKRPAQQGKDFFGDCEICGTALSFLTVLREMQFTESAFFVSDNKDDYTFNGFLHPDLQSEFEDVSLVYCRTIPEAYGGIRRHLAESVRGVKP